MIVTRQRPKQRQIHKIILPVVAVLLLVAALVLPPSRNMILNGPLAPLWRVVGNAIYTAAKPFHFAAMNNEITARDRTIAQLNAQITADKAQISDRDRTISSLQSQVNQVMQQGAADKIKSVAKAPPVTTEGSGFGGSATHGSDLAANATPDMRRTANYWASMDAESAAKLVQRQPISYAARIFALMPADAVGQILNNLPAAYAAALTQEHPELRR
ncbi:MAG: hypothetical protein ABR584_00825 [Candidatus Baltobacteraceae bacterium]